jgi:myosin heavy subunit
VDVLKNASQPLEDSLEQKRNKQVEVENTIKLMTNELNKINSSIKSVESNLSSNKEKLDEILEEYNSKVAEAETRTSKINQLFNEVNAYKAELQELQSAHDLRVRRDSLITQCKTIAIELGQLESTLNEFTIEEQSRKSKHRAINNQIQKLNDINNQKMENLRRYERDTYNAVEWLRKNKGMFRGEVLEPFQLIINVPNTANAKYIESIISRNDRKAFIFERSDDLNLFMKELRDKQKLNINAVIAPKEENFQSSLDANTLKSFGFLGYLVDFIECPSLAKRYLCKYYRIHTVPIGSSTVDKNIDRINKVITQGGFYFIIYH